MARTLVLLLLVAAFGGCLNRKATTGEETKKTLVFVHAQRLREGPCGCSLADYGGVARLGAFVTGLKRKGSDTLLFGAGPAFRGYADDGTAPEQARKTAGSLVERWSGLGMEAYGLSALDLAQGLPALRELQAAARFPFLGTNLVGSDGKPLFTGERQVRWGGTRVLLLGLTSAADGLPSGVTVRDPAAAVREKLVGETPDLVVILSSLSEEDRLRVAQAISVPHLILGGSEDVERFQGDQPRPESLFLNPLAEGRAALSVTLGLVPQAKGFHNPQLASMGEGSPVPEGARISYDFRHQPLDGRFDP